MQTHLRSIVLIAIISICSSLTQECNGQSLSQAYSTAQSYFHSWTPSAGSSPRESRSSQSSNQQSQESYRAPREPSERALRRQRIRTEKKEEERERREQERERVAFLNSLESSLSTASLNRPHGSVWEKEADPNARDVEARNQEILTVLKTPPPNKAVKRPTISADTFGEKILSSARVKNLRDAIVNGKPMTIKIEENPSAVSYANVWYADPRKEQVTISEHWIEEATKDGTVDPDFVRAIIWLESTHGWYDQILIPDARKSILPMNLYLKYWQGLGGYSDYDMRYRRDKNIEAGTLLIKELWKRTENPSIEKVASLYKKLGETKVSDYGKTVAEYYKTKPWLKVKKQ